MLAQGSRTEWLFGCCEATEHRDHRGRQKKPEHDVSIEQEACRRPRPLRASAVAASASGAAGATAENFRRIRKIPQRGTAIPDAKPIARFGISVPPGEESPSALVAVALHSRHINRLSAQHARGTGDGVAAVSSRITGRD
jgi:hypothetical protein